MTWYLTCTARWPIWQATAILPTRKHFCHVSRSLVNASQNCALWIRSFFRRFVENSSQSYFPFRDGTYRNLGAETYLWSYRSGKVSQLHRIRGTTPGSSLKKAYANSAITKVLEHCTTAAALDAVRACGPNVAGMWFFPRKSICFINIRVSQPQSQRIICIRLPRIAAIH